MKPILFYDGQCALCHGLVRWVVAHDPTAIFTFAPLQGETFTQLVPLDAKVGLPGSLVVRDESGHLSTRSDAVIFILRQLGWARSAGAIALLPRPVRDLGYRFVAKVRYGIFGRTTEMCPLLPTELRSRFLD